ncbi:MAG: hypothetical protein Ta2D_12140 [Rickettsiales bacterium]|nr:MAG: hypothetical protein Ta2D_12140 [Rickettsiales bacterium]
MTEEIKKIFNHLGSLNLSFLNEGLLIRKVSFPGDGITEYNGFTTDDIPNVLKISFDDINYYTEAEIRTKLNDFKEEFKLLLKTKNRTEFVKKLNQMFEDFKDIYPFSSPNKNKLNLWTNNALPNSPDALTPSGSPFFSNIFKIFFNPNCDNKEILKWTSEYYTDGKRVNKEKLEWTQRYRDFADGMISQSFVECNPNIETTTIDFGQNLTRERKMQMEQQNKYKKDKIHPVKYIPGTTTNSILFQAELPALLTKILNLNLKTNSLEEKENRLNAITKNFIQYNNDNVPEEQKNILPVISKSQSLAIFGIKNPDKYHILDLNIKEVLQELTEKKPNNSEYFTFYEVRDFLYEKVRDLDEEFFSKKMGGGDYVEITDIKREKAPKSQLNTTDTINSMLFGDVVARDGPDDQFSNLLKNNNLPIVIDTNAKYEKKVKSLVEYGKGVLDSITKNKYQTYKKGDDETIESIFNRLDEIIKKDEKLDRKKILEIGEVKVNSPLYNAYLQREKIVKKELKSAYSQKTIDKYMGYIPYDPEKSYYKGVQRTMK